MHRFGGEPRLNPRQGSGPAVPMDSSAFRRFSTAAMACADAPALCAAFADAYAALAVTRYHATWRGPRGPVVLACTYPFTPGEVAEVGARHFTWPMADGTSVDVRLAAVPPLPEPARAQLAGATMLFATRLWQLRYGPFVALTQQPDAFGPRRANMG